MLSTKKFYWIAQIVGWGSYSSLILFSQYSNDADLIDFVYIINILIIIVTGILITHLQRICFIKMGWLSLKLPRLIPRLLISSLLFSILMAFIDIGTDYWTNVHDVRGSDLEVADMIVGVMAVLVLILFWNAIYFTYHFFQKSRQQEISNLELTASNRESELKNLRSQLNPHFLFNSLNSIRALVDIEPAKSKKSITRLSNLLRMSLELGKANLVTLDKEIELVNNYLELEKIRFEERLNIEWNISDGLRGFEVPPFVLQMMVENAIKHGISNLTEGGLIRVSISENDSNVLIEVVNTGDLKKVVDLGVGIENIKKRLKLQYGPNATFELFEDDYEVFAQMKFKK